MKRLLFLLTVLLPMLVHGAANTNIINASYDRSNGRFVLPTNASFGSLSVTGTMSGGLVSATNVSVVAGGTYGYNGKVMAQANTDRQNYFLGGAGNLGMTGVINTAIGDGAFYSNFTGSGNVALGTAALYNNNADGNVAVGVNAMFANVSSYNNVAVGVNTLFNINHAAGSSGLNNTAVGGHALYSNTFGFFNTALGADAGYCLLTGSQNTFLGYEAGGYDYGLPTTSQGIGVTNTCALGANTFTTADNQYVYGDVKVQQHLFKAGNVGLGLTVPFNKLDVEGAVAIGAAFSGGFTGPVDGLIIEGRVGIGVSSPAAKLEVVTTDTSFSSTRSANDGDGLDILLRKSRGTFVSPTSLGDGDILYQQRVQGYYNGAYREGSQIRSVVQTAGVGGFHLLAGLSFDVADGTGNTPAAITILGNGNVGIGTNAPNSKLHVLGNANIRTNIGALDVTTNIFVLGTRYTNSNRRLFVSASIALTAAAAGTATVALYVENLGTATNSVAVSAGPLASLVTTEPLFLPVGPNMIYYFADETSGVGASAAILGNRCSRIEW